MPRSGSKRALLNGRIRGRTRTWPSRTNTSRRRSPSLVSLSAGVGCAVSGDRQRLGCGSLTRLSPLGELLACPRALLSRRASRRVTIGVLATAITPQTTAIPPRRLHGRCADRSGRASGLHDLGNQAWPSSPEPARLATELRFRRRRRLGDPRAATTQRRHGSPPRWSAACGMPAGRSDVVRLLPSSLLARELRRHVVHGEHEPEVKCINSNLSELCENR